MAHYCARIDTELLSEREGHYQQRSLFSPMFHLLSLVLDIDTYNYLSNISVVLRDAYVFISSFASAESQLLS